MDLAAAMPRSHSNTFFFDRCLGWEGLCIDADPRKRPLWTAPDRKEKRSCRFENKCVSHAARSVNFLSYSTGPSQLTSKIVSDAKVTSSNGDVLRIPCVRFDALLRAHNITHIDVLDLDIEGHEVAALSSLGW